MLDEMKTVMAWHLVCAAVFALVYGWRAGAVVVLVGLAWCVVLAIIPARKAPQWTPPK